MANEIIPAGNTVTFNLTATKDGSTWDITGATVNLLLEDPDGVQTSKSATLTAPASGQAQYVGVAGDFAVPGRWRRRWEIILAPVTSEAPEAPIEFVVVRDLN